VYESYLMATQRVLFHDAVLMQLAARFTGTAAVCAKNGDDGGADADAEAALDEAEEDQNGAADLADPGNDPATRPARDMFLEALAREQHDIGELKAKIAAARAAKKKHAPDKHDDRALRPSRQMMRQWGLPAVPAPVLCN
jgi:hypothetical protein